MSRTALLVVDVQEDSVGPGLYEGERVLGNIARLVAGARAAGAEVVFVQHDGAAGEDFEPGTPGWEIHHAVRPAPGEKIVRKSFNSAFRGTDLHTHFQAPGVAKLVVVGLHTEFCVDTTIRVAFELGYELIVPELTNTTFANGEFSARQLYEYHNERLFRDRFATLSSLEEALAALEHAR